MKNSMIALGLVASMFGAPAAEAGTLVKFQGGIGVDPVAGVANGMPVSNVVRGVNPGGRPWVISNLSAEISADGKIMANGEGLLLAGGDAIGTPGGVTAVAATLYCGTQQLNSGAVPLDAYGNFMINDMLSAMPVEHCEMPVLLIRNASGDMLGGWFAAGIPAF